MRLVRNSEILVNISGFAELFTAWEKEYNPRFGA